MVCAGAVVGFEIVDVVDISSSKSDSASYLFAVVVELALPDLWSLTGVGFAGEVSDLLRAFNVFRALRGTVNWGSDEPSFWLMVEHLCVYSLG